MKIENCPPASSCEASRAGKLKIAKRKGFTLIELIVAMFIFMLVMGAMVAVSIAGFRSYGKSKAVKTVTEDIGFAMNSMAKDIRMGKIEDTDPACKGTGINTRVSCLMVTRNATKKVGIQIYTEKVCYQIDTGSISV